MKKPTLLLALLCSLAVFFGWKTQEAWLAPLAAVDNAGRSPVDVRNPGLTWPDPSPPDTAAAVASVAARPLFRPDRQPFRDAAGGFGRNYDAELSRLSLIGVLTFGGDLKGLVVAKGSPDSDRLEVKKGDSLHGFKVKEVRIDGLVITAGGKEFLLPLYAGGPSGAAASIRTEVPKAGSVKAPVPVPKPVAPSVQSQPVPARPGGISRSPEAR